MGLNKIRDAIELAIVVSAHSGVPVLFLANPGLAKSTIIGNWAARNGYHLETLIGSRFTQEEILGFQVRIEDKVSGETYLELLEAHWYRSVIQYEKQNIPSLLFLDELSTVQENVQGAMLQLVFDRTIGHGKKLPDSTIIVSAANYKQNIPFIFNIMAPILNRFCIVNLRYENNRAFLDEFLQDEKSRTDDLPVYINTNIDDETKTYLREGLKTMLAVIFEQNTFDEQNLLDINNQIYNNIYESDTGYVYNFITGRTVYYLYRITLSFLCKGLSVSRHGQMMMNMVFGLIGLGTNSFNEIQQKLYLKKIETLWTKLYTELESKCLRDADKKSGAKLDFEGKSVSGAINEWVLYNEAAIFDNNTDVSLEALMRHISGIYGTERDRIENFALRIKEDPSARFSLTEDMQKIDYLVSTIESGNFKSGVCFLEALRKIQEAYAPLRESAFNKLLDE
ncbi:MAG: AAA family ATPase [Spirochaetaceae bacterium]|jgi:MoxR-like ATPase|nr:AAA family ATPase [Spirochaetaceae bacterium]